MAAQTPPRRQPSSRVAALVGLALAFAMPSAAEDPQAAPADPGPPPIELDKLLRLPSGAGQGGPANDLSDRERWEQRFRELRGDLADARRGLAEAQRELEELAEESDAWQVAAPGANPAAENSPLSYKLRQDIRGLREQVGAAERRLRDLEVEASLAGVPAEWRALPPVSDERGEPDTAREPRRLR